MSKTLVVVGGGAAGFFCAVNAARLNPALKVILVEKTSKLLGKVKVSGGGRCNVTHNCADITEMAANYPRGQHFVRKAFYQFFTNDTIDWFAARGVPLVAEKDGRMFPESNTSQSVIDCLLNEASRYGVEVRLNTSLENAVQTDGQWKLTFKDRIGAILPGGLAVDALCIASGGFGQETGPEWLAAAGHETVKPVPSLFTFNLPGDPIRQLMGISVTDTHVKIKELNLSERGPLLITHWGLSGPVILRLSAWGARQLAGVNYNFTGMINWVPAYDQQQLHELFKQARIVQARQKIFSKNSFGLSQRLWEFLCSGSGISEDARWGDLSSIKQNQLVARLSAYPFIAKGKTTFREEFVTAGGIRLPDIDPNTMQSKIASGLFFAGEVMDVDGITGGFNFQHAWTSGFIAAKTIAQL